MFIYRSLILKRFHHQRNIFLNIQLSKKERTKKVVRFCLFKLQVSLVHTYKQDSFLSYILHIKNIWEKKYDSQIQLFYVNFYTYEELSILQKIFWMKDLFCADFFWNKKSRDKLISSLDPASLFVIQPFQKCYIFQYFGTSENNFRFFWINKTPPIALHRFCPRQ